jgi:hypothetical protein
MREKPVEHSVGEQRDYLVSDGERRQGVRRGARAPAHVEQALAPSGGAEIPRKTRKDRPSPGLHHYRKPSDHGERRFSKERVEHGDHVRGRPEGRLPCPPKVAGGDERGSRHGLPQPFRRQALGAQRRRIVASRPLLQRPAGNRLRHVDVRPPVPHQDDPPFNHIRQRYILVDVRATQGTCPLPCPHGREPLAREERLPPGGRQSSRIKAGRVQRSQPHFLLPVPPDAGVPTSAPVPRWFPASRGGSRSGMGSSLPRGTSSASSSRLQCPPSPRSRRRP